MKFETGTSPVAGGHGHHHDGEVERGELQLKVEGMYCASCAAAVQRAIEGQEGVESASVNVIEGRAAVSGSDLDVRKIVDAVEHSGYHAELIEESLSPGELKSEIELRQAEHERLWRRRAIIGLSIWAPLETLHWIGRALDWHAHHAPGSVGWMDWVMFIGATVVMIAAGGGFYRSAWSAARRGTTNMDTLIAMGATTAYVYSLVIFAMKLFGSSTEQPLYFSEAAALLGIISLGHWMEARATARAGSAVRELLELQPDVAELAGTSQQVNKSTSQQSSESRIIPSAEVGVGDLILIRPGGRVPVDGVVVEGESEVDEAVVSGESMPVRKGIGDRAVAGSLNTTGRLVVRAEVDGRHTTIARIAEMVQRAQTSKANIQRLADRISSIFVPAVLMIALVTLLGWAIAGDLTRGVIATVTVLIISCPCALGLATPMAVMVGAGAASKRGILVKSAMALETAGRAGVVIFDKTGTLTAGRPVVGRIEVRNQRSEVKGNGLASAITEHEVLRLAAAVEAPSEHPIARAIVRAAIERNIPMPPVKDFRAIPGEGVRGIVEGHQVVVVRDEQTTCRVEVDGETIGTIGLMDDLRPDAKPAVDQIRAMGLKVMMLSGDRQEVAVDVGGILGLKPGEIVAEATPERKVEVVRRLAKLGTEASQDTVGSAHLPTPSLQGRGSSARQGGNVVMVGDGINDAAALAEADLGIAMASGTNIAIESADVVIPGDRVVAVPETIDIARQTLRTIKQNLFFAFFYNALAIPAAALGLLGLYGPLMAAGAMGLSDITVIGNAIRLKRRLSR
ncbi:MAG: cation-translocating P-type ATPase [Phycisphaerales bacterium]|nr:cation-translocating P-type ATPase [Phycisphaerales bacterium]